MLSSTKIRRHIEHFLRYSASIQYRNITVALMAIGAFELCILGFDKMLELSIKRKLSELFTTENNIIDLCLNHTILVFDSRATKEISRAFNLGYMQILNDEPQAYTPYYTETLRDNYCTKFMSSEDLTVIDNIMRLLLYGLIFKFIKDIIPPIIPKTADLNSTIFRSLMIDQKEHPYFSEIVAAMIKGLGLTESAFEEDLKKAGIFILSAITHEPILFPLTTDSGRSYDVHSLSALRSIRTDPLVQKPLNKIYYNQTLQNVIFHGVCNIIERSPSSEAQKRAFIAEWMKLDLSLKKILTENNLLGTQAKKKEFKLFDRLFVTLSDAVMAFVHMARGLGPTLLLPVACLEDVGGWQNPLPQLCEDLRSVLQIDIKGFQGAFDYGLKSASECINQLDALEKCSSNATKAAILNNPLGRGYDLQALNLETAEEWHQLNTCVIFLGLFLLLLFIQECMIAVKNMKVRRDRDEDIGDALRLIKQSTIQTKTVNAGTTLQQLKERYQEIQSQSNTDRDKESIMLLCTGCSYSYFGADKHEPCVPYATLIRDYDTTQIVVESSQSSARPTK